MPDFGTRLTQARVEVTSPTGVIELRGTGSGDLTVAVPRGALRGWTESALEREITAVIDATLLAVRRTYLQIRREVFAPDRPGDPADTDDAADVDLPRDRARYSGSPGNRWRSRDRIEIFQEAVEQIDVQGSSQRGYVTVARDQEHRFDVEVWPGTLRHLTEPEIAEEIHSALAAALASYRDGQSRAYRSAYGSVPSGR